MSKVICDVCGTTFPETANQCPICGSARNTSAQTAADDGVVQGESGNAYSYVKGGRFSKSNVRKRNKTGQPMQRRSNEPPRKEGSSNGSNKGLVAVVVILLLAIIAVCIYIGVRFFAPEDKPNVPNQTTTQPSESQQPSQSQTGPSGIACTDIQLSSTIIEFTDMERSQLLSAILSPVDTTDKLIFTSLDPEVATVTDGGLVTPVGAGETVITVTCGLIQKECRVVCSFADATEPTTQPPTEAPSGFELTFNTKFVNSDGVGDVTLDAGKKWKMYSSINVTDTMVIWSSDNEAIAKIENGIVTAVSKGTTLVHAEYGGVKYSCKIRVKGAATAIPTETTPSAEATTPTQPVAGVTLSLNRTDFTLHLSSTYKHDVYKGTEISASVAANSITWTSENSAVCTVENGVVTPVGVGITQIFAEYNGQKVSCIVRVVE